MLQKPETEIGLGFRNHLARIQTLPRYYGPGSTFLVFQEFVVCFTARSIDRPNSTVWNRKGNVLRNGIIKCRLFSPLCLSFSIQMLVSLGIQQRLLRFLERSRMSGAYSQQSSVSSVPSTARTNDSVVSEHCVRILNKLKTRGNETWRSLINDM